MEPSECAVSWAADPSEGDLIAPFARPEHRCMLPADHIHQELLVEEDVFATDGTLLMHQERTLRLPHLCACSRTLPVRDVEPAGQQ